MTPSSRRCPSGTCSASCPEWELPDWYAGQIKFLAQPHFKVTWLGLYLASNEPAAILDRKELATWLHAPLTRTPGFFFEQTAYDPTTRAGRHLPLRDGRA